MVYHLSGDNAWFADLVGPHQPKVQTKTVQSWLYQSSEHEIRMFALLRVLGAYGRNKEADIREIGSLGNHGRRARRCWVRSHDRKRRRRLLRILR
jgi:hypothetical protein